MIATKIAFCVWYFRKRITQNHLEKNGRQKAIEISAPGQWDTLLPKRSISDLYLDDKGFVWAVGTSDPGDQAPFAR
ncbi:MAG: hypothetical protein Q9M92_11260 [Enterobacterales bacterium]|nr:hypothetical protein [Enterobacterales bacterium]